MTRYLAITLLAMLAALCQPANADDLWTVRKAEHVVGSAVIAGTVTYYTHSEWEGASVAFAIGLAKEEVDRYKRGRSIAQGQRPHDALTCRSLLADAIGSVIGAKLGGLYIEHDSVRVAYSTTF